MEEHNPFRFNPRLVDETIAEIRSEEEDRKYVRKHAKYVFVSRILLGVAFVVCVGVSWGMASLLPWMFLALFLTWFFWIAFFLSVFVYVPHVVWWAYQRGVFDD